MISSGFYEKGIEFLFIICVCVCVWRQKESSEVNWISIILLSAVSYLYDGNKIKINQFNSFKGVK